MRKKQTTASDRSISKKGSQSRSRNDWIVIFFIAVVVFALAAYFQIFTEVHDFLDDYEEYHPKEIFIVLAILPLTFVAFSIRRTRELEKELMEGSRKDGVIRRAEGLNRTIVESLSEGIVIFNKQGQIIRYNPEAEQLLGIFRNPTDGKMYIRDDFSLVRVDGSPMPHEEWAVTRVFQERRPIMTQQAGLQSFDGTMIWLIVSAVPTLNPSGRIDYVTVTVSNVTDLIKAEEEKSKAMTTNAVIEAMGDGLILLNLDGKIATVNKSFEKMTGYPRNELIGMYGANLISNLIKLDQDKNAMEEIKETIEGETHPYGAIILQTKFGVEIPTAITASYMRDENGDPMAIITTFKNISNVLMLEKALRESNERFQRITAYANDAIFLVDDQGRISYWNPAAEKIFGYSKVEAEGKKLTHLILPHQFREELSDRMSKPVIIESEPFIRKTVESMAMRKDGEEFPIELSFSILIIKGSFFTIGIVRDISERKKAELALQESEEMQKALFEGSTDPIILTDLQDRTIKINPAIDRLFGYSEEELLGEKFPGQAGIDEGKFEEWVEKCRTGMGISDYETVRRNKAGETIPVSMSISPVMDPTGELISLSFWYRDITQRMRNEEQLRFQAHLLNSVRESVIATDLDGRITYWGRGAENLYKHSADEVLSQLLTTILEPQDALEETDKIKQTMEQGEWSGENLQTRKDGSSFWASASKSLVDDITGNPAGIISIERDISELKQTEMALRDSEERYRAVTETVLTGITMTDEDNTLVYVNTTFAEMMGYDKEEIVGMNLFDLTDRKDFDEHIRMTLEMEGMRSTYESVINRKDGASLNVLIAVSPLSGPTNLFTGSLCAFMDISDRIEAEQKIKASLEEKEVLLKEVHHRVKNNLQVVSSLLYLQSEKLVDDSGRSMLRESQNRVKSMALVHERLYQSEDLARINFADYIRNLGAHLFHSYGLDPTKVKMNISVEDIHLSIETAIPCGLVINELVSNALKHAFPEEGEGEISLSLIRDEDNQLTLSISDDGIGIPEEVDIKETDSMGLHLVNTLIRQLDATLTIDRKEGTKYDITFEEQ